MCPAGLAVSELKTASYHKPGQGSISAEVKVHVKHMVWSDFRLVSCTALLAVKNENCCVM